MELEAPSGGMVPIYVPADAVFDVYAFVSRWAESVNEYSADEEGAEEDMDDLPMRPGVEDEGTERGEGVEGGEEREGEETGGGEETGEEDEEAGGVSGEAEGDEESRRGIESGLEQ